MRSFISVLQTCASMALPFVFVNIKIQQLISTLSLALLVGRTLLSVSSFFSSESVKTIFPETEKAADLKIQSNNQWHNTQIGSSDIS
jgi:hypothetical protein